MEHPGSNPPYRRRKVLVNRPLQMPFVKAILLVLFTMALASVVAVQLAIRMTLAAYELTNDPLAVGLFSTAFWIIMLEFLVLTLVVGWGGILLTHKVAGPLVRIRAALAQLTEGRFDIRVTLRKGDALNELADDINRLAESLRARIR